MRDKIIKLLKIYMIPLSIFLLIYLSKNHFTINMTRSMKRGIYLVIPQNSYEKGDVVVFNFLPQGFFIHDYGYAKKNIETLIKEIKGIEGDKVEIKDNYVYMNNINIAKIYEEDTRGNKFPRYLKDQKIEKNYFYLGSDMNKSVDSRYFSTIHKNSIKGKVYLILSFDIFQTMK